MIWSYDVRIGLLTGPWQESRGDIFNISSQTPETLKFDHKRKMDVRRFINFTITASNNVEYLNVKRDLNYT